MRTQHYLLLDEGTPLKYFINSTIIVIIEIINIITKIIINYPDFKYTVIIYQIWGKLEQKGVMFEELFRKLLKGLSHQI